MFWSDSAAHEVFQLRCGVLADSAAALRCDVATVMGKRNEKEKKKTVYYYLAAGVVPWLRRARRAWLR